MKTKHKIAESVRITNDLAVQLINDRALREHRSASNAATLTVLEAFNKQNKNPGQPAFLNNVIVKDKGNLSSGNQPDKTE
jgi:hypothetical protein